MAGRFSFEVVDATDYDDLRPRYAPEAIAWVAERASLRSGSIVVDLAAGTGQLSGPFADLGAEVLAVEPAANMAAVLRERLPTIRIEPGTAEAIPVDDRSADLVVVGNAFHHFDRGRAFAEIGRVLTPGGVLALFWAWPLEDEQRSIPGMQALYDLVDAARGSNDIAIAYRSWAEPPAPADGFGPFERREFRVTHVIPSARLADLYATSSDVASMPSRAREDLLDRIRELASGFPEILRLPGRTVVDLCDRVAERTGTDREGPGESG
jgi:SAM-dependent methyltransferase